MRFSQDTAATNSIQSYSEDAIVINGKPLMHSVMISAECIQDWPPRTIDELTTEHMDQLVTLQPEIVIIGTGSAQEFPAAQYAVNLQSRGIGIEFMTNDAACRTFNILLGEERRVVVALMMGNQA